MGDKMSELPNDILCDIFSSLTIRDAFRVKSLSPSWKDLPDTRSLLHFDYYTIFGGESPIFGDKFVKAVEQFFKIWRAEKARSLKIKWDRASVRSSVVKGWIATAIGKEIEELDLDFSSDSRTLNHTLCGTFLLSCHLLDTDYLKHLRLTSCKLTMVCDASKRWLSKLRTLELKRVPLCLRDVECILSSSPKLESLRLEWDFEILKPVIIQLSYLKKLVIVFERHCDVELSCPQLETFEFSGFACRVIFSKAPLLKEASLKLYHMRCSEYFTGLARNAPLLQTLSLWQTSQIQPPPPSITMFCLKRLDLFVKKFRRGFDIFTIMHYLYACPVLEELKLQVDSRSYLMHVEERRYVDHPHFHLKEVKVEGVLAYKGEISALVEYLLRSGVSLEQVVFIVKAQYVSLVTDVMHVYFSMWHTINPTVKLVIEPV